MMIHDTDEELIDEVMKLVDDCFEYGQVILATDELRTLINHYIAKDRAQGQEPVAWLQEVSNGANTLTDLYIGKVPPLTGPNTPELQPLYTHAQPIAEIQAEALEKATEELDSLSSTLLHIRAAKLRKGESL